MTRQIHIFKEVDKQIKFKKLLHEILFIFILIVFLLVIFSLILNVFKDFNSNKDILLTCGDGTFYNSCSLSKPFFCSSGILIENASACSCPKGFYKKENSCLSDLETGVINLNFSYVLDGKKGEISFDVYEGVYNYVSSKDREYYYEEGELFLRSDFILDHVNDEIQMQEILPLIVKIQNLAPNNKIDQARIAISLVQNIPYAESNHSVLIQNSKFEVSRLPYQVLFENAGACEGKSELLALMLRKIGYGVSLFYYPSVNHESVGIKCPIENSLSGSGYCFIETTSPAILTDDRGEYFGVGKLPFNPEIVLLSEGISLPGNLEEYQDAKDFIKIRNKKYLSFFNKEKLERLTEKYGL